MQSIWMNCKIPPRQRLSKDITVDVAVSAAACGHIDGVPSRGGRSTWSYWQAERIAAGRRKDHCQIHVADGHVYAAGRAGCAARAEQVCRYKGAPSLSLSASIFKETHSCDFEKRPAYLYSTRETAPLEAEVLAARSLSLPASFVQPAELPFPAAGAVKFSYQAQFHPLKFLKTVSEKLTVYEHSKVEKVEPEALHTEDHTVRARHIVFATHYPFVNKPGYYFARIHQERSYVVALEDAPKLPGMYISMDDDGHSIRMYGKKLLLGGESHRTGENIPGRYDALLETAAKMFPGAREVARWSAQDAITLDGIPFIGRYARSRPSWHVATGFMKWGMTSSMSAAMILADDITGKRNKCAAVFRPQRFSTAELPQLTRDGAQAVKGLVLSAAPPEMALTALPAGRGGVVDADGRKLGAYRDPEDKVYLVTTRCPHLGCELNWNQDELSWDCPCHGSRFAYDGRLLSGPAQEGIKFDGAL